MDERPGSPGPLNGPDPTSATLIDALNREFGPLPLSFKAFVTIVGDVCFLGTHPRWDIKTPPKGGSTFVFDPDHVSKTRGPFITPVGWYPDPLVIEFRHSRYKSSVEDVIANYRERFASWGADEIDISQCGLDFAPDEITKAGYSGGSPYSLLVPSGRADARVTLDTKGEMYFIDYLRQAILEWGGFPGFEGAFRDSDRGVIAHLKKDLIKF